MSHKPVSSAHIVRVSEQQMAVVGDMLFDTALTLRGEGENLLPSLVGDKITVDLSQVERVGSAGISVLLCWMRMAQILGKTIRFVGVPDDMQDVSRVSSLDKVIPFSS